MNDVKKFARALKKKLVCEREYFGKMTATEAAYLMCEKLVDDTLKEFLKQKR